MSGFIETLKSIIDTLKADGVLNPMVKAIRDDIKQDQDPPYIHVGTAFASPYRTHQRKGEDLFFDINIWSSHEGNKESGLIMNEVDRLLGDVDNICIEGQYLIASYFEGILTLEETINDVEWRHIVYSIKVKVQDINER